MVQQRTLTALCVGSIPTAPSILLLALLAGTLGAQTLINPRHFKHWHQLKHTGGQGTSFTIRQVRMDPSVRPFWERAASVPTYEQYRVAVVSTQELPILITCGPAGRGCANWFPLWFDAPRGKVGR